MQSRIGPWKVSQSWSLGRLRRACKEAMLLIEDGGTGQEVIDKDT